MPLGHLADLEGGTGLTGLADTALTMITAAELRAVLHTCPPKIRRELLRQVKIPDAKRISPTTAQAMLLILRNGASQRRDALRGILTSVIVHGFGNTEALDAADCAALLHTATAEDALARAGSLSACLRWECPTSIRRWCLATVIELDLPLAPVALALLVTDTAEPGGLAGAVEPAWVALRVRHPALPTTPIGAAELCELARRLPTNEDNVTTTDPSGVAAGDVPAAPDLASALAELRIRFPDAADAAGRVADGLRAERRPDDDDLARIRETVAAFDRARAQAETIDPGERPAADLAALAGALETVREADRRAARLLALTGVEGPESMAAILSEVRDAARNGETEGLDVLAELIEVMGAPDGLPRALELAERAGERLPVRWRPLVNVAFTGRLKLGIPPEDETGPADGSEPPPPPPEPKPTPPPAPVQEAAGDDDQDDDLADLDVMLDESFPAAPLTDTPATTTLPERATKADAPAPLQAVATEAPKPVPSGAARPTASAPDIADAEAAALRAGRFGLAGRLRTAAGRPEVEERARRCAALAGKMVTFAGPLSAEFSEVARPLNAKVLADDLPGGLLAWAAAVRASLVHPTPESTRLLEELTVRVSGSAELAECGAAFIRAARNGAYLGPGLAGRIRGSAEAAMVRRKAVSEASRLLEEGQHRKTKYQFATEVWKALVQEEGPIGGLLVIAMRDDPAEVDAVVEESMLLRSGDAIDRLIDETSTRITVRRKNKSKKIIAGARAQLVKKVESALETVGRWAVAVKEAGAGGIDVGAQDWRLGPLGQLQDAVGDRRAAIDAALGGLATGSDPVLAAAVDAARALLGQALDLLDGASLGTPEPPVAHVLNRHLLLAEGVTLDPVTYEPAGGLTAEQLVPVARAASDDWTAAFEHRAARLDHEGTRAVIAVLEREDPKAAADLRERRDKYVRAARQARDARIEEIRDRIAERVRDGVLTEDQVRGAEETLRSLSGDRLDFDRVDRALDDLASLLSGHRRAHIEEERARVAALAAENPRIEAVIDRVTSRIDAGDLITAREFVAQIEAGNPLPEVAADIGHLERFYPAFPSAFADFAIRAGNRARKQDTPEILTELMKALEGGRDVTDPDLSALLSGALIKIPALRNARREEAREGLRQWKACGLGSKTAGNLRTATTAILRMIGLEGEQHDGAREQHRVWIDLVGDHRVGETPLPAFGTRMSPSGDRLRLVLVWRRPGPQQLIELLKGQPEDQTILVCYFGVLSAGERQQLAAAARRRTAPVVAVLDDAAIGYLACMPEADWSAAVALTAPFTATNPYAPVGDVPAEMFYGRDDQLREVTGRSGSSFVYGGRQLGKSALLRKAQRDIQRSDPGRTVILENIQTVGKVATRLEALWSKLADKLAQAGVIPAGIVQRDQVREAVRAWAREDPRRQLLILLDEADQFLNQDAKDGFENVTALRDLMSETDRRVKVVFAGLHQTARFESLPNQPLAHLGQPVAVGPLDPQNAFDLLVRPLAALGFRFPETLAARVIAEANNAPALVQLFAAELLTRLRRNPLTMRTLPYEITRDDVEAVWRDKTLVRGFRDRFEWTLNLDKRYKVIAYTVALHALAAGADETLSVGELWEQCLNGWATGFANCPSDDFRGLLDECVNLGVLGLDRDRYRLRTPHILNLLGGIDDVQKVLDNADEFELPDRFDAGSYRGVYRDGPERSPLSSAQLARLARPQNSVYVVAGSPALHADRVHIAIEAEQTERPNLKVHRVARDVQTFEGALLHARRNGHTVIVVDEDRNTHHFSRRLAEAGKAVTEHTGGTLAVVLVTTARLAPEWVKAAELDSVELLQLRRFEAPAIRQWMSEDSQGFPDEAGQDALLARTGGWPTLIGQVVHRLAEHGGNRDQALDHCRDQLLGAPAEFVRSTGVLADAALAAAWRVLVDEDDADTPDNLAVLLDMHAEDSAAELAPSSLEALGYASTADLVEALRMLGALVPDEGRMACEPVLAEATRHMAKTL
ncbi:hypothetical protein [Spirillospora sp. NBC_01491]|uniref:hypothetical protein n=1 Tax=Spirillospora sp. NBC_01491 TaxID=2976007 RepID=UPI002E33343B|nr:hypothetical protein [Spirillospora sp. NBC_01491]